MKKVIIFFIRCYQIFPSFSHCVCRFTPTCSEYMIMAINKYGVKKGIILGLKRIKRCAPGKDFGYDPLL